MENLPVELTMDILSRLPVITIIHCKRVCKKWKNLVSDCSFVNLHLSRSPTGIIFHQDSENIFYNPIDPGFLKWLEIEDKVDLHRFHHDPLMSLDLNHLAFFLQNSLKLISSVNGLIFLSADDLDYICNPITREFLTLPSGPCKQGYTTIVYDFGVSSLTKEYKVVWAYRREIPLNENQSCRQRVSGADVYTLGTGQWRSLGGVPLPYRLDGYSGKFLNDHYHWIVCDKDAPERICTFDFNKETFQLFPSPPSKAIEESERHFQSLGVLKGCLCRSVGDDSQFTIWVMKEYGIKKSWHKEVVITVATISGEWPFAEPISLIECLKDGTILLHSRWSLWQFHPRGDRVDYMEGFNFNVTMKGLAYRPSFLKLQNFESERVHTL